MEHTMKEKTFTIINNDVEVLEELKSYYEAQADCTEVFLEKMTDGRYKLTTTIASSEL